MSRFLFILFLLPFTAGAQITFSLATDASLLRNFDKKQRFTVFGQSVYAQWHLTNASTFYAMVTYHLNGKYRSTLTAQAKQPTTQPPTLNFTNNSEMRLRQISVGYKHYFIGSYDRESSLSLYGTGGFGLIVGSATNNFSTAVDTSQYTVERNIVAGSGDFKRLSLDLMAGIEIPIDFELYLYSEIRVHIPTTDYPSNYLLKSDNAPLLGGINLGIRILFNTSE